MGNKGLLKLLIYERGSTMRDNESIPSKTHFQKEIFLLLKETVFSKIDGYGFVPHYYGPFSTELDSDLIGLTLPGEVDDTEGYVLTPSGFKEAHKLWNKLDQPHKSALIRIKEDYNRVDSGSLVEYVYGKLKNYTVKSAIMLDNLYDYFESFAKENKLTIEDIDDAFNRVRHPVNESSY